MYFYGYEGWDDPRTPGALYVSLVDERYIIEYIRTEDVFGTIAFIFKAPSGNELRIGRPQLKASYKVYIDPWASQKAWAKKYGFTWVETEIPAVPISKVDY
jgi:hypothetical protein